MRRILVDVVARDIFIEIIIIFFFFFDVIRRIIVLVLSRALARRRFLVVVVFLLRLIFLVNRLKTSALDALVVERAIAIDRRIEQD